MNRVLIIGMLMLASLILNAQKAPKLNPYVLQYDAATGKISHTEHIDTIVWFGNGLGLARVSYENGKFDAKLAGTKSPDFEKFNYGIHKQAWGIIDTAGKFRIPPIYCDVDVWGNKMGMMYKLQSSKKFCGYLYCYILDMNQGKLKYLGDKVDRAYFAGPDFIVLQTLNENVGVMNLKGELIIDTNARRSLSFGRMDEKLNSHATNNSCETPPTLSNLGRTDNPELWMYSDPVKGRTVVDGKFNCLIPWGKYSGLYYRHGIFITENYKSARYSFAIHNQSGQAVESNLDSCVFDEELQVWKLYRNGNATYRNRDLSPASSEVEAMLNNRLAVAKEREAEAARLKEAAAKAAKHKADSIYYARFDAADLAGRVAGSYKEGTFIFDTNDPNFKANPNQPSMYSFKSYKAGLYFIVKRLDNTSVELVSSDGKGKTFATLKQDSYYQDIIRIYDVLGAELGSYTLSMYELRIDTFFEGKRVVLYATKEVK